MTLQQKQIAIENVVKGFYKATKVSKSRWYFGANNERKKENNKVIQTLCKKHKVKPDVIYQIIGIKP